MSMVKSFQLSSNYLSYATLGRLFKSLSKIEELQLTDYILSIYCDVDFERAISFYGSLDKMILAIDSNTGSEHDLKEEWVGYTDTVYVQMGNILLERTGEKDIKKILMLSETKRRELCNYLLKYYDFNERQVEKYLQLSDSTRKRKKVSH